MKDVICAKTQLFFHEVITDPGWCGWLQQKGHCLPGTMSPSAPHMQMTAQGGEGVAAASVAAAESPGWRGLVHQHLTAALCLQAFVAPTRSHSACTVPSGNLTRELEAKATTTKRGNRLFKIFSFIILALPVALQQPERVFSGFPCPTARTHTHTHIHTRARLGASFPLKSSIF